VNQVLRIRLSLPRRRRTRCLERQWNAPRRYSRRPQFLSQPAKVSNDLAASVITAVKAASKEGAAESGKLEALQNTMKASFQALLLTKLVQSPYCR